MTHKHTPLQGLKLAQDIKYLESIGVALPDKPETPILKYVADDESRENDVQFQISLDLWALEITTLAELYRNQ